MQNPILDSASFDYFWFHPSLIVLPRKHPEVEICIQEVYWGVILGSTPVGREERIVQREGVMYEAVSAKPFANLTEKDGTE